MLRAASVASTYVAAAAIACLTTARPTNAHSGVYGVVIDAGSSGSRVYVYQWPERTDRYILPRIQAFYTHKVRPGISAFVNDLPGLTAHVTQLLRNATDAVPEHVHARTNIYMMATAGMRLILEDRATDMMAHIKQVMLNTSLNPFLYRPINCRILSGEEEGSFAWIAVNYITGFLRSTAHEINRTVQSTGIVELGGASLQFAFSTRRPILADKFPLKIGGRRYPLYVHSYLHYGQDYIEVWLRQRLVSDARLDTGQPAFIADPCRLKGDTRRLAVAGHNVTFGGTSDPEACEALLDHFVYKVEPTRCFPKPCSIGSVYQPSIVASQRFYALAAFRFTLEALHVVRYNGSFTANDTRRAAVEYCKQNISEATMNMSTTDPLASTRLSANCLIGLFVPLMLTRGFGFPEHSQQISVVNKLGGISVEWSLGALIYENEKIEWQCPPIEPLVRESNDGMGDTSSATCLRRHTLSWNIALLLLVLFSRYRFRDEAETVARIQ